MKPNRKTIIEAVAFIAFTMALVDGTHHYLATLRAESIALDVEAAQFGHLRGIHGEPWQATEAELREQIRKGNEAR